MAKANRGGKRIGARSGYATSDRTLKAENPMTVWTTYTAKPYIDEEVSSTPDMTLNADSLEILEIQTDGNGNLTATKAKGKVVGGSSRYPVMEYHLTGNNIFNRFGENSESNGINWDNVRSIKGSTYGLSKFLRPLGFRWDGASQTWKR